jgi:hypothetical protein
MDILPQLLCPPKQDWQILCRSSHPSSSGISFFLLLVLTLKLQRDDDESFPGTGFGLFGINTSNFCAEWWLVALGSVNIAAAWCPPGLQHYASFRTTDC